MPEKKKEDIAAARELAKRLGMPYVELAGRKIDPQVVKMLPEKTARQFKAIPVEMKGDELLVAFVSPLNLPARDEVELITGSRIIPAVAAEKEIEDAINRHYKIDQTSKQTLVDMRFRKIKEREKRAATARETAPARSEEPPVARLIDDIVEGALNARASDVHFEPEEPEMVVRYRIDGILHDSVTIPRYIESAVISRIKIMANMDITEKRLPQDGHITFKKSGREFDLRVSTLLTVAGEKAVLRILDRESMLISLEKLGLAEDDEETIRFLISRPYGMILVTGPTGCGKTTTLYAVLSRMNSETDNIVTVENPVEYRLNRINQIQIDPASKITFATALRTILRQDPDKIMVGEIRDLETAEVAVQASLTGHLVMSTMHTNDAPGAMTRFIDMGVEPFLISSTVIGSVAQRLARTICPECMEEYAPTKEELASIGMELKTGEKLARGKGCGHCYNTGFRGRTGIFEVMKMTDSLREMVLAKEPAEKIKQQAVKEGMRTLRDNGVRKVLERVSTIEEVRRVVWTD